MITGNSRVGFGKYAKRIWKEVPIAYIEWLAAQSWFDEGKSYYRYVNKRLNNLVPLPTQATSLGVVEAYIKMNELASSVVPDLVNTKEDKEMKNWSYKFKASPKAIDFDKIADDLSYAEPLCIVEQGDKAWAVIHKSIPQKVKHSKPMHLGILDGWVKSKGHIVEQIDLSDIKYIKEEIKDIKLTKWKKSPLSVTVTKVNV